MFGSLTVFYSCLVLIGYITHSLLIAGSYVSLFFRQSLRQLILYNAENLSAGPIDLLAMDSSPAILIPYFDPDTKVVFVAGKVNRRIVNKIVFLNLYLSGRNEHQSV